MSDPDRARFLYTSIMRQVSECGPDEQDKVVGFHGKEPESTIKKFIVDGELVPAKYERLELIKFDRRMSSDDLGDYYREEKPLDKWADEDSFFQPDEGVTPDLADTDNGRDRAVSPVAGVLLMVVLMVVLSATLAYIALGGL